MQKFYDFLLRNATSLLIPSAVLCQTRYSAVDVIRELIGNWVQSTKGFGSIRVTHSLLRPSTLPSEVELLWLQRITMRKSLLLLAAVGVEACQREHVLKRHVHGHIKRQASNATFPPVLDSNEQILINSFDNTSISTWSYYYTHGDHVAGRNESMAQWTADKW